VGFCKGRCRYLGPGWRNCQYLWIGAFQVTSDPTVSGSVVGGWGVMSTGRSSSLPLWMAGGSDEGDDQVRCVDGAPAWCAATMRLSPCPVRPPGSWAFW
jgi:hypothetical protein